MGSLSEHRQMIGPLGGGKTTFAIFVAERIRAAGLERDPGLDRIRAWNGAVMAGYGREDRSGEQIRADAIASWRHQPAPALCWCGRDDHSAAGVALHEALAIRVRTG